MILLLAPATAAGGQPGLYHHGPGFTNTEEMPLAINPHMTDTKLLN